MYMVQGEARQGVENAGPKHDMQAKECTALLKRPCDLLDGRAKCFMGSVLV